MPFLDSRHVNALLFGLSDDLARELLTPLSKCCGRIQSIARGREYELLSLAHSSNQVIFCGTDIRVVTKLRETRPDASIIVVSRYPEVSGWLDSIEAGATDYCAAPFETAQVQWILETSMRASHVAATA